MKNSKKFLSSILAVAMLASMSLSSFAADTPSNMQAVDNTSGDVFTENGSAVNIKGKVKAPKMKVSLPASTAADGLLLNPYKVKIDGADAPQVISAEIPVENYSTVPVDVFVKTATATPAGDLKISAKAPTAKDTDKNVYLVLRTGATAGDIKSLEDGKLIAGSETKVGDVVITADSAPQKTKTLVAQGLAASTDGSAKGGTCVSKIVGQMSPNPTEVYKDADTITVATVYIVRPSTVTATK